MSTNCLTVLNLLFRAAFKGDQGFATILQTYPSILEASAIVSMDTPLHIAARMGDTCIVKEILSRKPEYARSLNQDGYTPLHLASLLGHLEVAKELIHGAVEVCLLKDKYGRTPLYYATMMGRVEVMKELLDAYPESIKEVSAGRETVLNVAVFYNQYEAYKLLLERFVQENNSEFIDYKDSEGNTALYLHLATSRIQFQANIVFDFVLQLFYALYYDLYGFHTHA